VDSLSFEITEDLVFAWGQASDGISAPFVNHLLGENRCLNPIRRAMEQFFNTRKSVFADTQELAYLALGQLFYETYRHFDSNLGSYTSGNTLSEAAQMLLSYAWNRRFGVCKNAIRNLEAKTRKRSIMTRRIQEDEQFEKNIASLTDTIKAANRTSDGLLKYAEEHAAEGMQLLGTVFRKAREMTKLPASLEEACREAHLTERQARMAKNASYRYRKSIGKEWERLMEGD